MHNARKNQRGKRVVTIQKYTYRLLPKQGEFLFGIPEDKIGGYIDEEGDFVYLDPPYLVSFATYNPGWSEKEERDMLEILDSLNSRGVRFAMSNALENKGEENTILKEWVEKNGFNVVHFNASYSNSAWCRKDRDTKTDEVLIMNY